MVKMRFFNSKPNLFSFLWSHLNAIFGLATNSQRPLSAPQCPWWSLSPPNQNLRHFVNELRKLRASGAKKKGQVSSLTKKTIHKQFIVVDSYVRIPNMQQYTWTAV